MNAVMKVGMVRRTRRGFRAFSKAGQYTHLSKAGWRGYRADDDSWYGLNRASSDLQNGRGHHYSLSTAGSCPPPLSRVSSCRASEARSISGRNESSRVANRG